MSAAAEGLAADKKRPATLAHPAWHDFEVPVFRAKDTRKDTVNDYETATLRTIFTMPPGDSPKDEAVGFIPSTYCAPDARSHQAQRERGQFVALTADVDEGDHPLAVIEHAARQFAGECAWFVYSSSSSRPGNSKWRIVLPLDPPLAHPDWFSAQTLFHDELSRACVVPDRALARAAQPVFAPNVPSVHVDKNGSTTATRGEDGRPLYFQRSHSALDAPGLDPFRTWHALDIAMLQGKGQAENAQRATIRAEAASRRAECGPGSTPLEHFNSAHRLTDLLLQFGYEPSPANDEDWRSPLQTSGSFATRIMTDETGAERWVSLSQSDNDARLGRENAAGCSGDAFDLFVHFEHDGDREAALAATRTQEAAVNYAGIDLLPPPSSFDSAPASRFRLLSLADLEHEPRREPVIKGLIARGDVGCIFGEPGAGKSVLAPYLALRVASGQPAFGMKTVAGPVLYIGAEDPQGMGQRLRALAAGYGHTDNLHFVDGLAGIMAEDKSPEMSDLLKCIGAVKPTMIVIDTLAAGFPIDENASLEMGKVVRVCRRIASLGPAVCIVHHSPKRDTTTPRGHSILNGDLDMSVRVEPADTAGVVRCTCMKNRNGFSRSFGFKIKIETLGIDEEGDSITAPICEEIDLRSIPKRVKLSPAKLCALSILDKMARANGRVDADAWADQCAEPGAISKAKNEKGRRDVFNRAKREMLAAKLIATGSDVVGDWVARPTLEAIAGPIEIPSF